METFSKRLTYAGIVVFVLVLLAISYYVKRDRESVTYSKMLMGTVVQVSLMEGDRRAFDKAAEAAFDEIKRLEKVFSSYIPESEVSKISTKAGVEPVAVSPEVMEVVKKAFSVAELSDGAFDPTVGVLGKLWGLSGESGKVPSKGEVERLLPLVGFRKVVVDEAAATVFLPEKGMVLNLGGISKGYIVSRAVEVLKKNGVTRGIIHAGGDMTVFQDDGKKPFTIGIQHPREKRLLGEAYVMNGAVATSGDYERYFEKDGVRYHHILDPKTGFPATGTRSVTLIANDPTIADGLSTALFVMGPEKGAALVKELGVQALFVDDKGRVTTSGNFQGKIFR